MKNTAVRALTVLALVLGLAAAGLAQTKTLTILHANDTHSALLPIGHPSAPGPFKSAVGEDPVTGPGHAALVRDVGGIARMAALIKSIKARGGNVLTLHAGDACVGSFEFNKYLGYPELKIMEGLYDAMALGNHEFDLGIQNLANVVNGLYGDAGPVTLPLLCANIEFAGLPVEGLIQKSIVKEIDGVKVGIFGVITEEPMYFEAEVIAQFGKSVYEDAGEQAYALRAAGCEIVVCLSHLGTLGDLYGLADNVPGIDIIVGGHSHDLFDQAVVRGGKIVVQAGSHGRWLGELAVDYEPGVGVTLRSWTAWPVDSRIVADPLVHARVNELRRGIVTDPRFGTVYSSLVALAERDIEKEWPEDSAYRDTPLGILVADAMKKALEGAGWAVDCVLDAHGYTSFGIAAGKVVGSDIMRAVPYGYDPETGLGFKLVVAPLPPALILGGLEYSVAYLPYARDICIQPSGLTFAYDSSKPPAANLGDISRLDPMSVRIGDEYVAAYVGDPTKYYFVGMSEQVFDFLNNLVGGGLVKYDTGLLEYNAVRDFMRGLRRVDYVSEGRVIDTAALTTTAIK